MLSLQKELRILQALRQKKGFPTILKVKKSKLAGFIEMSELG